MCIFLFSSLLIIAQEITLKVHPRGVYQSHISVIPLSGEGAYTPFAEKRGIKSGETAVITFPENRVPGKFVLRYEFLQNAGSQPDISESLLIVYQQDLELYVNPMFAQNSDSTYFQDGELENNTYHIFNKNLKKQKGDLGVLQNFLMNYRDTESAFYTQAFKKYENKRTAFNNWLKHMRYNHSDLFVSRLFLFEYIPQISFAGSEQERIRGIIATYFEGIDFSDSLILKTSSLSEWMNNYVNLYGSLAKTPYLRDSLFVSAGINAIEEAKQGHPLVYGWMVDYFYNGYEANGIDAGIRALEPYINDPNCLTSKRREINRRIEAIASLVAGTKAPNIVMKDVNGKQFNLDLFETEEDNILLLFWSAGCAHCVEAVNRIYPWTVNENIKSELKVVAIGLDDFSEDILKYNNKLNELEGWVHLHAHEGVNSQAANDYGILSTPNMFLIDSRTKTIKGSPNTLSELQAALKKQ